MLYEMLCKPINSLKEMQKQRKKEYYFYVLEITLFGVFVLANFFYDYSLAIALFFGIFTILSNEDIRYWDLKMYLLNKTKLEKEKVNK